MACIPQIKGRWAILFSTLQIQIPFEENPNTIHRRLTALNRDAFGGVGTDLQKGAVRNWATTLLLSVAGADPDVLRQASLSFSRGQETGNKFLSWLGTVPVCVTPLARSAETYVPKQFLKWQTNPKWVGLFESFARNVVTLKGESKAVDLFFEFAVGSLVNFGMECAEGSWVTDLSSTTSGPETCKVETMCM